jgi:hypothetical protein
MSSAVPDITGRLLDEFFPESAPSTLVIRDVWRHVAESCQAMLP